MEREVFRHQGTLDKYLGDGLMATFGTPFTGNPTPAMRYVAHRRCWTAIDELNRGAENRAASRQIRISIGIHYGQVVLGDIGLNRLEFAVIGTTVNAASRL